MFTRLAILAATVFALGFILAKDFSFTVCIALLIAIAFQVKQLLEIFEKPNPQEHFSSKEIKFDEVTQTFKSENADETTKQFCSYLNESLSKFPIYATFGVPEIWRYDAKSQQALMYELRDRSYVEVASSRSFPVLTSSALTRFIEQSKTAGQKAALAAFREWLRNAKPPNSR